MGAVLTVGAIVIGLVLAGIVMYNQLVALRNRVEEAWGQIDVELKRRHDLIGNLVETVKGYAAHERGTLEDVISARSAAMSPGQSPAQQAESENILSAAMGRLFALAEAYPDLKANENFLALQGELTSTEDRIASARRYYNAVVRELNTKVETVPYNIVAGLLKIGRAEYFETEGQEREVPQVDFGQRDATIPQPAGYTGGSGPAPTGNGPTAPGATPTGGEAGPGTVPAPGAPTTQPLPPSGAPGPGSPPAPGSQPPAPGSQPPGPSSPQ